jgi:hypothetical protein
MPQHRAVSLRLTGRWILFLMRLRLEGLRHSLKNKFKSRPPGKAEPFRTVLWQSHQEN